MATSEKKDSKLGITTKNGTVVGLSLLSEVESMHPGEIRIVSRSIFGKVLIRYHTDGVVTIVELDSGNEIYKG